MSSRGFGDTLRGLEADDMYLRFKRAREVANSDLAVRRDRDAG